MSNIAYLPIVADRYGTLVRHIFVVGLDMTGIPMRAQVRLEGDTPGTPEVDLVTVTNGNAEGLRLVEVTTEDGLPKSHIEMVINETTMERLPYLGEIGDVTQLRWDMQITFAGRKRRLVRGEFEITGDGVTGAEVAPTKRPQGSGRPRLPITNPWRAARLTFGEEQVTVTIDGTDLIAPLVGKAGQSQLAAAASERDAAANAAAAQLAESGAIAAVGTLYPTTAAGLAATAANGFFTIVGDGTSTYGILYQKVNGAAVEKARYASKAAYEGPGGAALIGFRQAGAGAVMRDLQAKGRDVISVKDFGAIGDGGQAASEHAGITAAAQAVQNPNDAYFSGTFTLSTAIHKLTAPVSLPASFVFMEAQDGTVLWGAPGHNVIDATGAALVRSALQGFRTYGGQDGLHIETQGEVANVNLTDITFANFTRHAFFSGVGPTSGLTSSKLSRVHVDGIGSDSGHGMYCLGINNNNVVSDSDFGNFRGDVFHIVGRTQGWQFRHVRVEGRGQPGRAQYSLERPFGNHILGGWSENSHEYLLRIPLPQDDARAAGVIIDGHVSIGSADGQGGFIGSKFDTGSDRIVLGSNAWFSVTQAPPVCFVYGVNHNLRTDLSVVWTRDAGASFHVISDIRKATGTTRSVGLTLTRPNTANVSSNQQLARLKINVLLVGLNTGGTPVDACIDWDVSVRGGLANIAAPKIEKRAELDGYSAAGVTLTCTAGAVTESSAQIIIQASSLSPDLESALHVEVEGMSTSFIEANRFVLSVQ